VFKALRGLPVGLDWRDWTMSVEMPDKTCPNCAKPVPYWNNHCFNCGYSYPDTSVLEGGQHSAPAYWDASSRPPSTLIRSYEGGSQADASGKFQAEAASLNEYGYQASSQSWAARARRSRVALVTTPALLGASLILGVIHDPGSED
jgi:hypothetical protein